MYRSSCQTHLAEHHRDQNRVCWAVVARGKGNCCDTHLHNVHAMMPTTNYFFWKNNNNKKTAQSIVQYGIWCLNHCFLSFKWNISTVAQPCNVNGTGLFHSPYCTLILFLCLFLYAFCCCFILRGSRVSVEKQPMFHSRPTKQTFFISRRTCIYQSWMIIHNGVCKSLLIWLL